MPDPAWGRGSLGSLPRGKRTLNQDHEYEEEKARQRDDRKAFQVEEHHTQSP